MGVMTISRFYDDLTPFLAPNRVLIIYGPRRAGKTTLIERYVAGYSGRYRLVSGEDMAVQEILSSNDFSRIIEFCEGLDLLVIDEAQAVANIGRGLKIIVDHVKNIRVIATGSSSFDLANQVGEPLVGRHHTIRLYPVAQLELREALGAYDVKGKLKEYLRFGSYPEVLMIEKADDKREYLSTLTNSYLYKDILALNTVKNADILQKLVKRLAFAVGSEVAPNHFSRELGIDVKTVAKYLDLLEKNFIIFRLQGFSRNLANEITKKHKYYFCDLGVRNAVINQFNDIDNRDDIGAIWENFMVLERIKRNHYKRSFHNSYFWRTYEQHEVDYVEEKDAKLMAYEIKWNDKVKSHKGMHRFVETYDNAESHIVNQRNYLDFIC